MKKAMHQNLKLSMIALIIVMLFNKTIAQNNNQSPSQNPLQAVESSKKGLIKLGENETTAMINNNSVDISELLHRYEKELYFTENKGQWPQDVLYKVDFPLGQAIATDRGMLVGTFDHTSVQKFNDQSDRKEKMIQDGLPFNEEKFGIKGHGWLMNFLNASPSMKVTPHAAHSDVFNYFLGDDASKHATDVANYKEVWYNDVYKNTDLRYYPSENGMLEYDIICKPGSDPREIAIQFEGLEKIEINSEGHLILKTSVGDVELPAPYSYQKINGAEVKVESHYKVSSNNVLSFEIGNYEKSTPLIIDPIALRWATWMTNASTGANHGHGIWVDQNTGDIYVMARVDGAGLILVNAFDSTANGGIDIIVGKYNEPANIGGSGARLWQTYIGGSADDNPYALEQGPDGNLYMVGLTGSTNLPLLGGSAFSGTGINKSSEAGDEAFVMKINPAGNSIKAAVVGGSGTGNGDDGAYDLRFTPSGSIVVGGRTQSNNLLTMFPGTGATNSNGGSYDAWIFQINSSLETIAWMRNFGGSGTDIANILLDNPVNGDIFVGGTTASSSGIPMVNARQNTFAGSSCGFLQKLDGSGNTIWSSYFTSSSGDATSILCMEFNQTRSSIYFGGLTEGLSTGNISTSGVYDNSHNGLNDFFICNIDTNQTFVKSTYLGSTDNESNMMGMNVDQNNDVYVFGYSQGTTFPTAGNPLQSTKSTGSDKTFSKLSSNLSSLLYSTFYGGGDEDYDPVGQRGIKFSNCRIYTIVTSESNNIPLTQGALTTTKSSSGSIFEPGIVIWANPPDLLTNEIGPNQDLCQGETPDDLTGSVPSYSLPTISRNGALTAHPSVGVSTTYSWQISTDSVNWTTIQGATGQNITGAEIGTVTQTTFIRRIINGDACVIAGSLSLITIRVLDISGSITYATCSATIATSVSGGVVPLTYLWSNGSTNANLSGVGNGIYTVTVSSANGCSATASFNVSKPTIVNANCSVLQNVDCFGGTDGIAQVVASSGSAPYVYQWSTGASTTSIINLASGTYTVTVTDDIGCTQSCSSVITSPLELNVQCVIVNNPGCTGSNNGQLDVNVSGGTINYNYLWSNGTTTSANNNLGSGTYTVTVTDANGCSRSCSSTIVSNDPPSSAITGNSSVCSGNSTQWCAPSGLSAYLWSSGATTQCIVVSQSGSYTVTVTDQNGCTSSSSKTLVVNQLPSCSITGGNFCQGSSTQLCAATNSSYIWNTGATTQCITTTTAGTFTVTVTNADGCTSSCSKTVTAFSLPSSSITGNGSICSGSSTQWCAPSGLSSYLWSTGATTQCISVSTANSFTVTVTDANGCTSSSSKTLIINSLPSSAITGNSSVCSGNSTQWCAPAGLSAYLWSTGATTQCIVVSQSGSYTVTVTDQNGCTASGSKQLNIPSAVTINKTITAVACFGGNNGAINITASGGTPGYTYLWNNGNTNEDRNGLSSGTYTVTVSDANGCTASQAFTVAQPANLLVSSVKTPASCNGGTNGSINVTATGGTSPYSFLWNDGNTNEDRNNLSAGVYSVTVTDANGCTKFITNSVGQASQIVINKTVTNLLCANVCNGSIALTVTGGTAPYNYLWSNAQTNATATGLCASTYTVTITDANGCTKTSAPDVTQPNAISGTIVPKITSCFGSADGSINVNMTGGIAPFTFIWNDGNTSKNRTGLTAGNYTVTATDVNGCTYVQTTTVSQPAVVSLSKTKINPSCYGGSNGSIDLTATGGTPGYTYLWNDGITTEDRSGIAKGTYTVVVNDSKGCSASTSVFIGQPSAFNVSMAKTDVSCFGGNNGTLDVTVSGATPGYTYLWNDGITTQDRTGLSKATYTVTITDAAGCTTSLKKAIAQPKVVAVNGVVTNVSCNGSNNGSIAVTVSGGTSPFTYLWNNGVTTKNRQGLAPGNYTITVTDSKGCTKSRLFNVTQPAALTTSIASSANGVGSYDVNLTVSGGTPAYSYLWNGGQTTEDLIQVPAATYSVTVTDNKGCTATNKITIQPPCSLSVDSKADAVLCYGTNTGQIQTIVNNGSGLYTVIWSNGATTLNLFGISAGTYTITINDPIGCSYTNSWVITEPTPVVATATPTDVSSCSTGKIKVDMSGGVGPYTAKLYNASNNNLLNTLVNASQVTFSPLNAGNYYVVVIDAKNCSKSVSASIANVGCIPPANINDSVLSSTSVRVYWSACTGNTFRVRYNETGTTNYQFVNVGNVTSAVITNLTPGQSYNYRVKTICGPNDESVWSDLGQFCINCGNKITDADNNEFNISLTVIKNPVVNELKFTASYDETKATQILISDMFGRTLYSKSYSAGFSNLEQIINVENMEAGMYSITLINGNETTSAKFIKQ